MREEPESRPQPEVFTIEQLRRDGWYGLVAPIEPAETFTLIASSNERVDAFLRKHGCQIRRGRQSDTIVYPAGTTRQRIYPRITDDRFRLRLPDGTELREIHRRAGDNNLLVPRDAVEREIPEPPAHEEETP